MSKNKKLKIARYNLNIPNWDKTIYPENNYKKSDLVNYYKKHAQHILEYIKNYVITMHRFPDGINNKGFYQKKYQDYYPDFLNAAKVKLASNGSKKQVVCYKDADIVYLAGQAVIEFHYWLSKATSPDKPQRIIFDLDPPDITFDFKLLVRAARKINDIFNKLSINCYVMTTGSRGLHVVVPIKTSLSFDEIRNFSKKIAKYIADKHDEDFTIALNKKKRRGRIFIDYTRNAYGQTTIAPYSLRAKENAPVATPLAWDELNTLDSASKYNICNINKRLAQVDNPWGNFDKKSHTISKHTIKRLESLLESD